MKSEDKTNFFLVHASIELCSLVLIATMQVLRTRWTGWRAFFGHKRTAIKVLALIVMIMEALGHEIFKINAEHLI